MKKATVLFFVLFLFSLGAVCQTTQQNTFPDISTFSQSWKSRSSTLRRQDYIQDSINYAINNPVKSPIAIEITGCPVGAYYKNILGPDGEFVWSNPDTKRNSFKTLYGFYYGTEDIKAMADWKQLISPKL
jgi:hypothetical protein